MLPTPGFHHLHLNSVDPEAAIGTLAPFIFHEIVHALDTSLWDDAHKAPAGKK